MTRVEYQAAGLRCAIDMSRFSDEGYDPEEVLRLLVQLEFKRLEYSAVELARQHVGSPYRLRARVAEAPGVFDCSSFTKWIYSRLGIRIPRLAVQQRQLGEVVEWPDLAPGDLVFGSGRQGLWIDDESDSVGHVGLASGFGTIIHAANKQRGVVEDLADTFAGRHELRGVRRLLPLGSDVVVTLICPKGREIESSEDVLWLVRRELHHQKGMG